MNTVTIVRASLEHLEALLPLVAGYRAFYEQNNDAMRERAYLAAHLRDGSSVIFLASLAGRPAGFAQLFRVYSTVHLGRGYILEDIFVAPGMRRHGVAAALLDRALAHARSEGVAGMFLETARDNQAARALYERAGWSLEQLFVKYNAPL
ncbi:MAG TPA: GNAT family N-acetyltransferase [Candidatus Baltobacteraceae bacterium]